MLKKCKTQNAEKWKDKIYMKKIMKRDTIGMEY